MMRTQRHVAVPLASQDCGRKSLRTTTSSHEPLFPWKQGRTNRPLLLLSSRSQVSCGFIKSRKVSYQQHVVRLFPVLFASVSRGDAQRDGRPVNNANPTQWALT